MRVTVGQHSDKGRKEVNQDFYGASLPKEPLLSSKGIAIALADGIGSSDVSHIASEFAVMGLLEDYYCTSDAWSVKRSVERVLTAANSWLHSRTQQSPFRHDQDRGYVCTLSALVLKSTTAHVFHVGDSRIYRLQGGSLEQLTVDHRVRVSEGQSYLSRAVGFKPQLEIDYHALPLAQGDVFVLACDGVYEHVDPAFLVQTLLERHQGDLDQTARRIVDEALRRGSGDNLTVQIVVVDELPAPSATEIYHQVPSLPAPPVLEARMTFDGYRIVRELHASHRSHIYLAVDLDSDDLVVLKTPSVDLRDNPAYLERFMMEEWVARRLHNAHVLKPCRQTRERHYLYVATEFIDGQTLSQWMRDHPKPDLETVRGIVEQIANGLQAFHRLEMLHQDLRPDNIMIDKTGTVKIIDFGATRVAGIDETAARSGPGPVLGTEQYSAPEYFLGEAGTHRSDLFSLAVITYQLLSGRLPYGTDVSKARTAAAQRNLRYVSVLDDDREIPAWIDAVLRKALHPNPLRRHQALSEFTHDLRHPKLEFTSLARRPLVEQDPVRFWKTVSAVLALMVFLLLLFQFGMPGTPP
ncbi:protein kinase [Caldimonas brevitalea]|uniref:Protein kinase n=1 Tax=Caldimonas brevitalea TaxID=413882 RepID=A0A0G3BL60_9BURK|nr:protein kinase [Caldimonas brevitalea]